MESINVSERIELLIATAKIPQANIKPEKMVMNNQKQQFHHLYQHQVDLKTWNQLQHQNVPT
jgi:hypothetical protein